MPDRVRIAHPRTDAARRAPARTPTREIDEQTDLGELYVDSLIRSQRRLAILVGGGTIGGLMVIAALAAVLPAWSNLRLLGISVPWLVLGFAVYPALIGIALAAVRRGERNEKAFTDLVRRR